MKLIDRETDGYIVEIAEGGPWLGHDLTVTAEYQHRGSRHLRKPAKH